MNLAECTSALRQKDGEKTIALEEIKNAEVDLICFQDKIVSNYHGDADTHSLFCT
jgi:hypothetical protein